MSIGTPRYGARVPLLYVDVLGVKARWQAGGPERVSAAFALLEELVGETLDEVDTAPIAGGVQTDAAALVFDEVEAAVRMGRALFRRAFDRSVEQPEARLWLRGVISPVESTDELTTESPLRGDGDTLLVRRFSPDLLRAINVEQSGVKGMRLLLDQELAGDELSDALVIPIGESGHVLPLKNLSYSLYPEGAGVSEAGYADVLWMIPDEVAHWSDWSLQELKLSKALRGSGRDTYEFTQIAATALTFSETAAILGAVGLRKTGGLPGVPGST